MDIEFDHQVALDKHHRADVGMTVRTLAFLPLGRCSWGSHPELSTGEIPCGAPEPRREELSHLLSASRRRRGRSAPLARPGEKLQTLQLSSSGQWVQGTQVWLLLLLLLLTAFPFSAVATANHRFPFYPIFCIF